MQETASPQKRHAEHRDDDIAIEFALRERRDDGRILRREEGDERIGASDDPVQEHAGERGGQDGHQKGHPGIFLRLDEREDDIDEEEHARRDEQSEVDRRLDVFIIEGNRQYAKRIQPVSPEVDERDRARRAGSRSAREDPDDRHDDGEHHRGGKDVQDETHDFSDCAGAGKDGNPEHFETFKTARHSARDGFRGGAVKLAEDRS